MGDLGVFSRLCFFFKVKDVKARRNKNEDNPSSDGMVGHEYFTIGNNWILIHRRIDII
jgi:hypothetical protein